MEVVQIMRGIEETVKKLALKSNEYPELLAKVAEAEKDYKIQRAKRTLELKSQGVQATLIPMQVEGDPVVAELKFNHDVADAIAKGCKSAMSAMDTAIVSYECLLSFEKRAREIGA